MKLDPWQEEILACKAKKILLCKGRQIGGTFTFARKCALRLISQKGCQIVVASITEDQAHLVIAMVLTVLENEYKSYLKKPYWRNITKSNIILKNKSQIISRPVGDTGNAVRGFTGDVLYLNEASRMREFVFEAAKAILLTTAGDLWMDSTPFGIGTYFHKCFENKNKTWKIFYHTSEEVIKNRPISDSWTEAQREGGLKLLEEEKEEMTKFQYRQEYLGEFVGGIQRFISDEEIDQICKLPITTSTIPRETRTLSGDTKPFSPNPGYFSFSAREYFLGVDIARMGGDETVLFAVQRIKKKKDVKEKLVQIDMEIPEPQRITDTTELILRKDKPIRYKKMYIDTGGMGVGVYDSLSIHPQTKGRVVSTDNASREIDAIKKPRNPKGGIKPKPIRGVPLLGVDMAVNLKVLIEQKKIEVFDDPRIRQSLRSMQYDNSEGKLRVYGNYNHIFEALKRAVLCVKDKSLNINSSIF